MLAHSPALPLAVDYQGTDTTAEDEEAILLALAQRDRVRRIRFSLPVLQLQKLITATDGEYPDRKSTRLNSSHRIASRMPSSA